jgi:D-alanyl-D-alanine carboxypeptidase
MITSHDHHRLDSHRRKAAIALAASMLAASVLAASVLAVTAAATAAASSDGSPTEPAAPSLRTGQSAPIVVADAYHGVGFMVCAGGRQLVTVADAYHGTGVAQCIDRPETSSRDDDLDALVVDALGEQDGGIAVLSIRDGETTAAVAGNANAAGDPITRDTPFRVGSISKPLVATMVLQLVDEGSVDLDEALSTYLPNAPIGGDVPIRMLLNHHSGLPNYTDQPAFIPDVLEDRNRVFTPDEILDWVEGAVTDEPGQQSAYSNTNYILLGQLIEQVTGTDLDTALHERISEPLGLEATRFASVETANPDRLAAPWSSAVFDGDPDAAYDSIASSASAAGSLTSTTGELAAFFDALFAGMLVSPDALDAMTEAGPDGYGLGLGVLDHPSGTRFYGHGGGIPGYTSFAAFDPSTGDTVVVLTNNDEVVADELARNIIEDWWAASAVTNTTDH